MEAKSETKAVGILGREFPKPQDTQELQVPMDP